MATPIPGIDVVIKASSVPRKKILVVGDAACPSGFAVNTHKLIEHLDYRCKGEHECTVLGINYRGDPHSYPYPIFAAAAAGDTMGFLRLIWMCDIVKPDVIIIQNDVWNFPGYLHTLKRKTNNYDGQYASVPVIGIVAIDGKNCEGSLLNGLSLAVFWTSFGLEEARKGGYTGPAAIVSLGVDTDTFYPMDKLEARSILGLPKSYDDGFIVGNVNRNQPRKRWDLTIKYFAEWVHHGPLKDAYLFLHVAPTGDTGIKVRELAMYYGVMQRLMLHEPPTFYGVPPSILRATYNAFDVQISTSQGEGFGLTTLEGMACRVPQIFGDWSALGEWAAPGGITIPCTSTHIGPPYVNVIGGIPDEHLFVEALDTLYWRKEIREQTAACGYALSSLETFNWERIGRQFAQLVADVQPLPVPEAELEKMADGVV